MKIKLLLALAFVAALVTLSAGAFLVWGWVAAPPESVGPDASATERVLGNLAEAVGMEMEIEEESRDPLIGTLIESLPPAAVARARLRIHGAVNLFGLCDEDSGLVVFATAEATTLEAVMEQRAINQGLTEGTAELVIAEAEVTVTGEFELELTGAPQRVHLLVAGDHGYQHHSQAVSLASDSTRTSISPSCGASITGRVFLPGLAQEPAADLTVRLNSIHTDGGIDARRTERLSKTDAEGRFSLTALPLPGNYTVEIEAEEFSSAPVDAMDLASGETRKLVFLLTEGAQLKGRVIDSEGRPVAAAKVSAGIQATVKRGAYGSRSADTDENGVFHLRGLLPERVTVRASQEAFVESDPLRIDLAPGEFKSDLILVLDSGASIAGQVTWADGSVLEGGTVEVGFDQARQFARFGSLNSSRGASGSATTSATGNYLVMGLGKGPFSVTISAPPPGSPDANEEEHWSARADSIKPGTPDLDLVLVAPLSLKGHVRDSSDQPLPEFSLRLVLLMDTDIGAMARSKRDEDFGGEHTSGAPGEFALHGLSPGQWAIYASAAGHANSPPITRNLPDEAQLPLEFRLERALRVSGIVLSPRGVPVAGAEVKQTREEASWREQATGAPRSPQAISGDDGSFLIEGLVPADLHLTAKAEGHGSSVPLAIETQGREDCSGIELFLSQGGQVTGEFHGNKGRPAAGALIQLISMPGFEILLGHADNEGRFDFKHVTPGRWRVIAMPNLERLEGIAREEGNSQSAIIGEMKMLMITVVEGETQHIVLGDAPADPLLLSGLVLGRGQPVAAAMIGFTKQGSDLHQQAQLTSSDENGAFQITLDGGGDYIVTVSRTLSGPMDEARDEFLAEIEAGGEAGLTLHLPESQLSGSVMDQDGAPAVGVRITLSPRGAVSTKSPVSQHYTQTHTDGAGHFRIEYLPGGTYTLALGGMHAGGLFERTAEYGRVLQAVHLTEGEKTELAPIVLRRPTTAHIVVSDASGRRIEGATIFARNEAGDLLEAISMLTTSSAGVCEFAGLAPGNYSFSARKRDRASLESALLPVGLGAPQEVELELLEGTLVFVRLRDPKHEPVTGKVFLHDSEGRELQSMMSLESLLGGGEERLFDLHELVLGPLAPGKYRVTAESGSLKASRPLVLTGRTERKITLRLR